MAIARHLLSEADEGWTNLGLWSEGLSYNQAARALALRVGEGAELRAGARVLDLGCGYGASLRLWRSHWQVGRMEALEADRHCRAELQGLDLADYQLLPERGVRELWQTEPRALYDAIVSVDAAYHFPGAQALLHDCRLRLKPGSWLALSSLVPKVSWSNLPKGQRLLARLAGLQPKSLVPLDRWQELAKAEGWENLTITSLRQEVLAGFAAFVPRRRRELSWLQKASGDWLKIEITARWALALSAEPHFDYALIRARVPDGR